MGEMKTATAAEFERLADTLADLARVEYMSGTQVSPKVLFMGVDPEGVDQSCYRFGFAAVEELFASMEGVPAAVLVSALVEKLSRDPEILVVGFMAEAWQARYTREERERLGDQLPRPEEAANREEVLLLNLRSADCAATKVLPLTRDGAITTVGEGKLVFRPKPGGPSSSLVH